MALQIGPILDVAVAVNKALTQEAANPHNSLQPEDVRKTTQVVTDAVNVAVSEKVKPVVEVLTNQEPWYRSPQAWMTILSLLSVFLGIFKISFDDAMQKEALTVIMACIGAITGVVLFWNRYIRRSALLAKLGWVKTQA